MKHPFIAKLGMAPLALSLLFSVSCCQEKCCDTSNSGAQSTYEPTIESLSRHNAEAEWLKDAKLGIYFHWGPYVVPAFNTEWYPRSMHQKGALQDHHIKTFGEEFHYHDFIPRFTAEKFDPKDWAELFKASGAKFAGPVAEHHDGFSMWDSDVTPFNAADMGPKRDILGDLFGELRAIDMKTIATFHHARNLQRYQDCWEEEMSGIHPEWFEFWDSHYPFYPEYQEMMTDPKYQILYGTLPAEEWYEKVWLGKLTEVIDNYHPDIIWFDSWLDLIPEEYRLRFAAHYFNEAQKNDQEVVVARKQEDLPLSFSIFDHEKSREPKAKPAIWMTDDTYSMGSWSYTEGLVIKPTEMVVHSLIDAVSKNGILLLNISPKADGTIPEDQRKGLLELGAWLQKYGEAIYNTRPWQVAAEGPTVEPEGGFADSDKFLKLAYSSKDVRYTAAKDGKTVYAMLMGIPAAGDRVVLNAFTGVRPKTIESLNGDKIQWHSSDTNATVQFLEPRGKHAYILKITLN